MPQVEVRVLVLGDLGQEITQSEFTLGPALVNQLANRLTPEGVANLFIRLFRDSVIPLETRGVTHPPVAPVAQPETNPGRIEAIARLVENGSASPNVLMRALGLEPEAPPERAPDPIRGVPAHSAMIDDSSIALPPRERTPERVEAFRRGLGFLPSLASTLRVVPDLAGAKKEPIPPEDRTAIPTRYERKPVI